MVQRYLIFKNISLAPDLLLYPSHHAVLFKKAVMPGNFHRIGNGHRTCRDVYELEKGSLISAWFEGGNFVSYTPTSKSGYHISHVSSGIFSGPRLLKFTWPTGHVS